MELKISADPSALLTDLDALSPEIMLEIWAEAVSELARRQAVARIGNGFGRSTVANSVISRVNGLTAEVWPGGESGYIAAHVHTGGRFRARSGKLMAVPIDESTRKGGQYAGIFPRNLQIPLFVITSKRGNKLLVTAEKEGKERKIKPLFVLKRELTHTPRPWFPTEEEANREFDRYYEENFAP